VTSERKRILQMLTERKISVDECDEMIGALTDSSDASPAIAPINQQKRTQKGKFPRVLLLIIGAILLVPVLLVLLGALLFGVKFFVRERRHTVNLKEIRHSMPAEREITDE